METIDILNEQEETLGTAEDLREEIALDADPVELPGNRLKVEFETSRGLCTGYYSVGDSGHEELEMEPDSVIILVALFPSYNGTYLNTFNRDWVEIDLTQKYDGCPEYKIYHKTTVAGLFLNQDD